MSTADTIDRVLEATVVPSFTRIGPTVRSRLDDWRSLSTYDLSGRTAIVTGATSGLGRAAAEQLVACGAEVVIVGRDQDRLDRTRREMVGRTGAGDVSVLEADLGDLVAVRRAAETLAGTHEKVDVLIHNAGALLDERRLTDRGTEVTVASQVVGPFLLTGLLLDVLGRADPGRVITMSSGGMYTADLTVDGLEMSAAEYRGAEQYARAKRAQVTLNEMWAARVPASKVVFHALHPGWAGTPGVVSALPMFAKVLGPLLRTPDQGADTMVWLAADDTEPLGASGGFWLDRRRRPIHRLKRTEQSDTPERRDDLWNWCVTAAGIDPLPLSS